MLQEGQDIIMLKSMYANEDVQIFYKCYGLQETLLTNKLSGPIGSNLATSWQDLFSREPLIQASYEKVKQWNDAAPKGTSQAYYLKEFCVNTHIQSSDNVKLVYNNVCIPMTVPKK